MAKIDESLLKKIKLMIGEHMDSLNNDFFNQEVEGLKRRVEQLECTKTHEEVTKTLLKEVSKLERHVTAVMVLQEEAFSAAPQSEMEERKLEVIDTTEEHHNSSEDFQAISSQPPGINILPRIPLRPELAEELEDSPQNPETRRALCAKSKEDSTVMDP